MDSGGLTAGAAVFPALPIGMRTAGCVVPAGEACPTFGGTAELVPGALWGAPDVAAGLGEEDAPSDTAAPPLGAAPLPPGAGVSDTWAGTAPVGLTAGVSVAPLPATGGCPEFVAAASGGAEPAVGAAPGAAPAEVLGAVRPFLGALSVPAAAFRSPAAPGSMKHSPDTSRASALSLSLSLSLCLQNKTSRAWRSWAGAPAYLLCPALCRPAPCCAPPCALCQSSQRVQPEPGKWEDRPKMGQHH